MWFPSQYSSSAASELDDAQRRYRDGGFWPWEDSFPRKALKEVIRRLCYTIKNIKETALAISASLFRFFHIRMT